MRRAAVTASPDVSLTPQEEFQPGIPVPPRPDAGQKVLMDLPMQLKKTGSDKGLVHSRRARAKQEGDEKPAKTAHRGEDELTRTAHESGRLGRGEANPASHHGRISRPRTPNSPAARRAGRFADEIALTGTEIITRVGSDNPLERLTECSIGLVADRPRYLYELLVTLL